MDDNEGVKLIHYHTLFNFSNELHELTRNFSFFVLIRVNSLLKLKRRADFSYGRRTAEKIVGKAMVIAVEEF